MSLELERDKAESLALFYALKDRKDVAVLLEIPEKQLAYHLFKNKKYKKFTISKRNGGDREILAPDSALKVIQRKLSAILYAVYSPKNVVHGFMPDRSVVTNARLHVGRSCVLNVDIEEFFPTIHFGRVRGLFAAKPYNIELDAATVLAQICCHDGHLPQGAPTSPIVSNMICGRLDSQLKGFCRGYGCTYSRYADDSAPRAQRAEEGPMCVTA